MTATTVVTAFLRNRGEVLLLHRGEAVGSYPGKWGAVSGHGEGDPAAAVETEIEAETGLDLDDDVSLVRRGDTFNFSDDEFEWRVHPFLFDCETRTITTNWESTETAWVAPPAIHDRETVPKLWASYDRVRPTVESVASDTTHGSAYISMRALEVLRDEAALATQRGTPDEQSDLYVELTAGELIEARPTMTAVANRLHRVMSTAESVDEVETCAHKGISRTVQANTETATNAAALLGDRVATLSRSGTVRRTLERGNPDALLVAESRPGGEGVAVAESFADETDVILTSDAAFASQLGARDVDTLVIGADTVLADGRIVNKVGTRSTAIAASHEGINPVVVASTDKISPEEGWETGERDADELYTGDASLTVANPTFEVTKASVFDGVVTERGLLSSDEITAVAAEHRQHREWFEAP